MTDNQDLLHSYTWVLKTQGQTLKDRKRFHVY